jgi:hypothetical protein
MVVAIMVIVFVPAIAPSWSDAVPTLAIGIVEVILLALRIGPLTSSASGERDG